MMSFAQVAKRGVVGGLRQQVLAKRGGFGSPLVLGSAAAGMSRRGSCL